jgi:hypothetical protein
METNQAGEAGIEDWQVTSWVSVVVYLCHFVLRWRPLESAFAVLGSQARQFWTSRTTSTMLTVPGL